MPDTGICTHNPEVLGPKALKEWDKASKGQKVPQHVKKKK